MENPHGRRSVTRRAMLTGIGSVAALYLARHAGAHAGDVSPMCVLTPAQTEGPYFVDERLNRSDIRSDPADGSMRAGIPLVLTLRVAALGANACAPLPGAFVDVWHCDADGVYSDVVDSSTDTRGRKFLRGHQLTDTQGIVRFTTIYPGWYPGRAVHIHFKVRAQATSGAQHELTSQLYFDEAVTERVFAREPYVRSGRGWPRNAADGIFRRGGERLMLAPVEAEQGYAAAFDVTLRLA